MPETDPLLTKENAAAVADASTRFVKESANKIKTGVWSFRTLGLIGGLAMILTNGMAILGRIIQFKFSAILISVYCLFAGVISK